MDFYFVFSKYFLDPEGVRKRRNGCFVVLVVTVFEECIRLCYYATESYET